MTERAKKVSGRGLAAHLGVVTAKHATAHTAPAERAAAAVAEHLAAMAAAREGGDHAGDAQIPAGAQDAGVHHLPGVPGDGGQPGHGRGGQAGQEQGQMGV